MNSSFFSNSKGSVDCFQIRRIGARPLIVALCHENQRVYRKRKTCYYTTIFSLIVANSDSIVTTADKQAACIRIIRRMRCFLLSGK